MSNKLTVNGEAIKASQEGLLMTEQYLQEKYLFRFNVLSGKTEFADLPADGQPQYRILTTKGNLITSDI